MTRIARLSIMLASATALTAVPFAAAPVALAAEHGSIKQLVDQVAIPHETFKLDNGLTVIVHEDRKAPIVAVSVWYNVGSKDEPKGKTGFAHLFEHIMFNGSENLPGDYFEWTEKIGATNLNGTTWFDRTNYFQNVPTGALERALFMESDRMGYLLGAVTQDKLTNQIGVVQNEKRQGDNRPGGLVYYEVLKQLFPEGHPYRHSTIGSMADLDSASLGDVQQWFIDKYGPNNAVLVLAGDINAAEARPLVEKYFGAIPSGPINNPAEADVPTLSAPVRLTMQDRVATVEIQKHWAVGGLNDPDYEAIQVASSILGGLASSRLDNELVRGNETAVSVSTSYQSFHRVGFFEIDAEVKPGVEPNVVEQHVNRILLDFVTNGPSQEEIDRAVTQIVAGRVRGLERIGGFSGKANTLAEGLLYSADSDFYKKSLEEYADLTPEKVRAAAARWLVRPSVTVRLEPGARPPYEEAKGSKSGEETAKTYTPTVRELPPIGETPSLDFPDVQQVTLSNGVTLNYAQRDAVPITEIALRFDAGRAADAVDGRGLSSMTMDLLEEGAGNLSAQQIAEEQERLGAQINASADLDESIIRLSALSANLGESLGLLGTIVKQPTFAPAEVERVKTQRLAQIEQAKNNPNGILARAMPGIIYGNDHPYASDPYGDEKAIAGFSQDDFKGYQNRFLRPDKLEIYVVSSLPLDEVKAALDAEFGGWTTSGEAGSKTFTAPPARPGKPHTILIDRPDSPQSIVAAAQLLPIAPKAPMEDLFNANDALGGNFLSRINMDLRETKGWSYGVRGSVQREMESVGYLITAPVQADRTADSIKALDEQVRGFLGSDGVTEEELERIKASSIAGLPGQFETASSVLTAMMRNDELDRPTDYYETLADVYRAQTREGLDKSIRDVLDPDGFVWVVIGDAKSVAPQLDAAGIAYEVMPAK